MGVRYRALHSSTKFSVLSWLYGQFSSVISSASCAEREREREREGEYIRGVGEEQMASIDTVSKQQ